MKHSVLTLIAWTGILVSGSGQTNRSIDGFGNNIIHPDWGAAGITQLHDGSTCFGDFISTPGGQDRPGVRMISNTLFMQNTLENDLLELSAYCWAWGQFIDHDITLVEDHASDGLLIPIPSGDIFFDPAATGTVTIPMKRSNYDPASGTSPQNHRKFINSITAFIDASAVYGSDDNRANWLRSFLDGKLRMSTGNLLPWNTTTGEFNAPVDPVAPGMAMPIPFVQKWFVAGDVRANENPFLTSIHTLFVREHNRLCDELKKENPAWNDEQLYQHARKIVGGLIQAIVYEEWLPAMGMEVPFYPGYRPSVNPGVMNVFSAAAYRYGHTAINSILVRMNNEGEYIPQGDILLRDAFFNPSATTSVGGIEPYLIGMATVVQQNFDCKVVDDLRNFLFGAPGQGGMDLVCLNITRGRERGVPDYNTLRSDFGLPIINSFDELSSDPLMNQTMVMVYGDHRKIDAWVGLLAEDHMPGAFFGKTAMTIIKQQFMAIRDGDRYYYENDPALSGTEIEQIRSTRLSDIIRRNTPVTIIQDEIFKAQSLISAVRNPDPDEIDFALYPNPAREMIFLRILAREHSLAVIRVVDLEGKIVMERSAQLADGNNTITLTLPQSLPNGIYALLVQSGERQGQQLFVRER